MSDLSDRDRVTAILTLAEAAAPAPWLMGRVTADGSVSVRAPSPNSPSGESDVAYDVWQEDAYFIAASRSETPWLARRLLEALDTIDRLEAELDACQLLYIAATNPGIDMDDVKRIRAGQALNGGNE